MHEELLQRFQAEPLSDALRQGWMEWSLDFFTDRSLLQCPYLDITLQLDVTDAYHGYRRQAVQSSFFAFLIWHLAQQLSGMPEFNLRLVDGRWYLLRNPPIFVPVAVGGQARFQDMLLENAYRQDYDNFARYYAERLQAARAGLLAREEAGRCYFYSHLMGNLPYLSFTAMTLHWQQAIEGHSSFYFGKRYFSGERLLIPLAVKLHHAVADPLMLNQLLQGFAQRFSPPATPAQP